MQALLAADKSNIRGYCSLQPHYNLVHRAEFERELAPVCRTYQLGVIPYSPLGAGFLTGKYRRDLVVESQRARVAGRYFNERNWALIDKMEIMGSQKNGASISQIALAWLLSDPLITSPIIGPRNLDQLKDNLGVVGLRLTAEEKGQLDEASSWSD